MRIFAKILLGIYGTSLMLPSTLSAKPFIQTPQNVVAQIRKDFNNTLIDYKTARFRDTFMVKTINEFGDPEYYLCGWVNSKNHFNGYTGWQRFKADYVNIITYSEKEAASLPTLANSCDESKVQKLNNTDYAPQLSPSHKPPPKTKK